MTAEREKELLGLIEAYWRIKGHETARMVARSLKLHEDSKPAVQAWIPNGASAIYRASWAESEACLREVAGECAVLGYSIDFNIGECDFVLESPECVGFCAEPGEKRPVALLKAFVAAFSKEPA